MGFLCHLVGLPVSEILLVKVPFIKTLASLLVKEYCIHLRMFYFQSHTWHTFWMYLWFIESNELLKSISRTIADNPKGNASADQFIEY